MLVKEYITQELENLSESDLRQIAEYIAFIKLRARMHLMPLEYSDAELQSMYAEFEEEDLMLAEAGMGDYYQALADEDVT